jgi:predicted RNA binding protein YcfA (HicA-like mRNA interferase family)
MKKQKLLQRILNNPNNVRFSDARVIVESFGFRLSRTAGSHHIFVHLQIKEIVNLQNVSGQAKSYQIKQFLQLIERYDLRLEEK